MQTKTISLPKLNGLKPTLESTCLKLMEEAGELAREVGKFQCMSGETPNKEWWQTKMDMAAELLDVAQTAVSMMFVMEEIHGLNMEDARERHITKLINKGYLKVE